MLAKILLFGVALWLLAGSLSAQVDDMCREFGEFPNREVGRDSRFVTYVYGRVVLNQRDRNKKPPRVTVIYTDSAQPAYRQVLGRSGNYCFQRRGNGGSIVIDIEGVEVARRQLSDLSRNRLREDFEVVLGEEQTAPPSVVSATSGRQPNDKTSELYKRVESAEQAKKYDRAIEYAREIVRVDPSDHIAFAKLGGLYLQTRAFDDAEAAFKTALSIKADYYPAVLNIGIVYAMSGRPGDAVAQFERAVSLQPTAAFAHRLLGEAYLQIRQGSKGLASLDEALRLDPVGMAECHLLKARLYELAGAKDFAVKEYQKFLEKVPNHPERKKFEKFINETKPKT